MHKYGQIHLAGMAVTTCTLRQIRQMPHTEIDDFFVFKKYKIYNPYSDRNDIHWMNSLNVYDYRLKSTDIVAMKGITDPKDIRHQ